ncbi:microtubule associated-domain-containing protein [Armillaria novae-zelandiae]|uniref:Microtubule associated-domain-containing protein n=1 Tax=Armillaria novae-zelandiae TaxID=153914 RepID=A0AA39NJ83_9AGAR|nr:microtubule associated-domain-containing protein [Armillaria novae-zelandiae]
MSTEKVDISLQSTDISLRSLDSSFEPPCTSNTIATPKADYSRSVYLDDTDGDYTPAALRARHKSGAKGALTLRDQEKHIDHLKKENFDIKIKCHFLEERLAQLVPDQIDAALKQNIDLKIELSARGQEIKRLKKLLLELERELERMQRAAGRGREQELEEKLEERDREIRELRRRQNGHGHEAELEEQLKEARDLLEESNTEIERLREMMEVRDGEDRGDSPLKERVAELEAANEEWQQRMQNMADDYEEEKQELVGSIESMGAKIEQLLHRNEAQMQERSESRAMDDG